MPTISIRSKTPPTSYALLGSPHAHPPAQISWTYSLLRQVDAYRSPPPIVATASRHSSAEPTRYAPHRWNDRIWNKTRAHGILEIIDAQTSSSPRLVGVVRIAGTIREQPGEETIPNNPKRS